MDLRNRILSRRESWKSSGADKQVDANRYNAVYRRPAAAVPAARVQGGASCVSQYGRLLLVMPDELHFMGDSLVAGIRHRCHHT